MGLRRWRMPTIKKNWKDTTIFGYSIFAIINFATDMAKTQTTPKGFLRLPHIQSDQKWIFLVISFSKLAFLKVFGEFLKINSIMSNFILSYLLAGIQIANLPEIMATGHHLSPRSLSPKNPLGCFACFSFVLKRSTLVVPIDDGKVYTTLQYLKGTRTPASFLFWPKSIASPVWQFRVQETVPIYTIS